MRADSVRTILMAITVTKIRGDEIRRLRNKTFNVEFFTNFHDFSLNDIADNIDFQSNHKINILSLKG